MKHKKVKCGECNFFSSLKIKHNLKSDYNSERKIVIRNILLKKGLPLEICDKILNYYNKISNKTCSVCKNNLCVKHEEKAINNAKIHNKKGLLCGSCSWHFYF
jgi:hypothetical protein